MIDRSTATPGEEDSSEHLLDRPHRPEAVDPVAVVSGETTWHGDRPTVRISVAPPLSFKRED